MINKEFLEGLGITDEATVKSITDTYNADIKTEKDSAAAIQTQLDEANTTIKSYTDMDIDSVKKSAADWENKYKQSEADRLAFEHKTKVGNMVKGLKLKDSIYEDYLTNQIIEKQLKFEGDKLIGGDDVVKAFKEAHPDAFQTDPVPPKFSYDTHGGEATGVTGVEAAFLARNPGLKID
jgi:hypothetical protein